jgi:hypothetical protein
MKISLSRPDITEKEIDEVAASAAAPILLPYTCSPFTEKCSATNPAISP